MHRRGAASFIVLVSSCVFAACGGGGGNASSVPAAPQAGTYDARFQIFVPSATQPSSRARSPRYLSPSTRSLAIDVAYVSGAPATTIANVAPGFPGCTTTTQGTTCDVEVAVNVGAQRFTVRAYDAANGSGALLGTTTLAVPAAAPGQSVVDVDITLDGVVRTVTLALSGGAFTPGLAATRTLTVTASDADGNAIVAPGNYTPPIALTTSDSDVTLSTTTVTSPSTVVTATYDGAATARTTVSAILGTTTTSAPVTLPLVGGGATTPTPAPSPTVNFTITSIRRS
jgi:hypothetical protein